MLSGTGMFLYLGCCCRWLNFLIWQFLVILNTFFPGFVYNLDYILKVLVVEFVLYVGFGFFYVCLQFLDNSVAVSDPAVQDGSVCSADDFSFLEC